MTGNKIWESQVKSKTLFLLFVCFLLRSASRLETRESWFPYLMDFEI